MSITKASVYVASAVIASVVAINSFTIVGVGKEKAGATFGTIHESPLSSGFHIVNPIANYEEYDLQEMTYDWDDVGVPAQDNLKTSMDVHITGHFIQGMSTVVRQNNGSASHFKRSQLKKRVRSIVIDVGKSLAKDSQSFYGEKTLMIMEGEVKDRLNIELEPRGYVITAVKFSDVRLPPVVTQAVIKTKQRQQEIKEQTAKLEIQNQLAQEVVNTAKANRQASEENAAARKVAADAKLYEMQQEAAGNAELGQSVTQNLIKLKEAEAKLLWDGVMPKTVMGEGASVLIGLNK